MKSRNSLRIRSVSISTLLLVAYPPSAFGAPATDPPARSVSVPEQRTWIIGSKDGKLNTILCNLFSGFKTVHDVKTALGEPDHKDEVPGLVPSLVYYWNQPDATPNDPGRSYITGVSFQFDEHENIILWQFNKVTIFAPPNLPGLQEEGNQAARGGGNAERQEQQPNPGNPALAPLVLVFEPGPRGGGDAKATSEWQQGDWAPALRARLRLFEIKATVKPCDKGQFEVTLADASQKAKAVALLSQTGRISFHLLHPDNEAWIRNATPNAIPPDGYRILCIPPSTVDGISKPEERLLVKNQPSLKGDIIRRSHVVSDPNKGWVLLMEMTEEGARMFGELTAAHVRERLAIVMDDVVLAAPKIQQTITGGRVEISGLETAKAVWSLSSLLETALPSPLRLIQEPPDENRPPAKVMQDLAAPPGGKS